MAGKMQFTDKSRKKRYDGLQKEGFFIRNASHAKFSMKYRFRRIPGWIQYVLKR